MQSLQSALSMAQALGIEGMNSYRVDSYTGDDAKLAPYLGFIMSNWLTTLRFTNDWFKLIEEGVYYQTYPKVVKAILARPDCRVNMAVLSDDSDICLGFSVFERTTLHYCFVQRDQRKQKIATSLVPEHINTITHLTVPGVIVWKKKLAHAAFNPFV